MVEGNKLNLLDEELDEASQKYIQEALESWIEATTNQLMEQMEQVKQAKIEELEEQNIAYREQLKEEFTGKMLEGLEELKESIRADVTAEVIKSNPELKILEQVKELVAPLLSEEYRDSTYDDTILRLSEENAQLRREHEIEEGAKTLATLLAPYSEKTQKVVVSLIKEGNPEEVTEQFYNILETLSSVFEEKEDEDESEDDEDEKEDDESDKESEDDEDEKKDDESDKESEDDEDEKEAKESFEDDSYIMKGYEGIDYQSPAKKYGTVKNILKTYANL